MSSQVSSWLLLRLAILLAAFLAQSGEGATYRDLLNRHVADAPPQGTTLNAYCNRLMRPGGMTRVSCKPRNTFINSAESNVQDICQGGGTWWEKDLFNSTASFPLVDCRNRGTYPNCNYVGRTLTRPICVACGMPVHFERIL